MDNLVQLLDGLGLTVDDAVKALEKAGGSLPSTGGGSRGAAPPTAKTPVPAVSDDYVTRFWTDTTAVLNRPVTLWQLGYIGVAGLLLWRICVRAPRR